MPHAAGHPLSESVMICASESLPHVAWTRMGPRRGSRALSETDIIRVRLRVSYSPSHVLSESASCSSQATSQASPGPQPGPSEQRGGGR